MSAASLAFDAPFAAPAPVPRTGPRAAQPAWRAPAEVAAPDALERARARLMLALLAFVAVTLLILIRLVWLAAFAGAPKLAPAPAGWVSPRADIVDRNGVALARGIESYAVVVRPKQLVTPPELLAPRLAALLNRDPAMMLARLRGGPKRLSSYLARRATPELRRAVQALGDPGIDFAAEPSRAYPNTPLAQHLVGYVGDDGHGMAGMEYAADRGLRGQAGAPLSLSIDTRVQQALESELAAGMAKHSALGAAGVVMDVETGEVIALASLPTYDPAKPADIHDDGRRNHATLGVYELGSTFKALTLAMAFDSGVSRMSDRYDARRPIPIGRFVIHDDHPQNRILSVPEIFIHSSNIGTARIAAQLGEARQRDYLARLGFMKPLQIELPERGRPILPPTWGASAVMTVGFGHGISVTPVHLATAYAALVNGGIWRPATVLRVAPGQARVGTRVFSVQTSDQMRALLRLVVLKGTARQADARGYRIGGKTGTSNKVEGGKYSHTKVVSTLAAAFPMEKPRYVVVAMLDQPQGTKDTYGFRTAGWVSAPIVRKLVQRIAPILGVAPDLTHDVSVEGLLPGDAKAEE